MRCLNCRKNAIANDIEVCPQCNVHLPTLLRDILPQNTLLHNGAYKIEYPLGRGGFGITYRAIHTNLEQLVAIKEFYPQKYALRNTSNNTIMIPTLQQEVFLRNLERFKREGKILAKLCHPNIVQVRDLFEANNTAYLVMELLDGHTLRDELDTQAKRCLFPEQVKTIFEKLVEALDLVHQAGVYHLDIKPDNIILTKKEHPVLVDFGAAKQSTSTRSQSTRSYTQDYAAPEVMSGKPVGAESDIFELGMMLYEMLTGKKPPNSIQRLMESPQSWKTEGISSPWKELIEQALILKQENRPKSVRQWWEQFYPKQITFLSPPINDSVVNEVSYNEFDELLAFTEDASTLLHQEMLILSKEMVMLLQIVVDDLGVNEPLDRVFFAELRVNVDSLRAVMYHLQYHYDQKNT